MATNQRTYPNKYFAWYNDDTRVAIVSKDTENTSGERVTELYDTWQGQGDLSGSITSLSATGGTATATTSAEHNLETGDRVTISDSHSDFNGTHTITVPGSSTTTFTFSSSSSQSNQTGTFVVKFINDGIRVTYISKYEEATAITEDLYSDLGLDTGMQISLLYYVKARLYEDIGDMEKASYFRKLFYREMKQYPSKRTGIRVLSVPNI